MKEKPIRLSERYMTALRKHLLPGAGGDLRPALELGRRAVALGVETLELARMHESAVSTLELAKGGKHRIKQAEMFFAEVLTPIVARHRVARQSRTDFTRLKETLSRRTGELADANLHLQRGVMRRKNVEAAYKHSGVQYAKLLKDSLNLQEDLRQLTHQVLAAQEDERKKISLELQEEVAQTLLGINVRLVSLKKESQNHTQGLKSKIASTQRLVARSARCVRRVRDEVGEA